jgi:hypothetical protein
MATKVPKNVFKPDAQIWNDACDYSFYVKSPRPWRFASKEVKFGSNAYTLSTSALYALALLDLYAQYWECTGPIYLRRYHRGLQWQAERALEAESPSRPIQNSPTFLRPWLMRMVFLKTHDAKGRSDMQRSLKEIGEEDILKLKSAAYEEQGIFLLLHLTCRSLLSMRHKIGKR